MSDRGETNGHRPTIRDVAEQAGVSKSLVSLVMRGEPNVREDKRRRVQQVADELGYRMNLAARSLSNVRSKTIGVLVADLRNPSLVDVVDRAGQVFEDEGFSTLLISAVVPSRSTSGPRVDNRAIGALKDLRVEAMLVVGSVPDRTALAEILSDVPVVVAAAGAEGMRADVVRNDDHLGMRLVVDYLVADGHTAIAHLGGLGGAVAEERVAGYCAAMAHHGLEPEIVVADSDFTEDAGYRGAARLLRGGRPVTAIAAVERPGRRRGDVGSRRRRPARAGRRGDHRLRRHVRVRDPAGVADLGQPRQRRYRDPRGAVRAAADRRSRAPRGGAPPAATTRDAREFRRVDRWPRRRRVGRCSRGDERTTAHRDPPRGITPSAAIRESVEHFRRRPKHPIDVH